MSKAAVSTKIQPKVFYHSSLHKQMSYSLDITFTLQAKKKFSKLTDKAEKFSRCLENLSLPYKTKYLDNKIVFKILPSTQDTGNKGIYKAANGEIAIAMNAHHNMPNQFNDLIGLKNCKFTGTSPDGASVFSKSKNTLYLNPNRYIEKVESKYGWDSAQLESFPHCDTEMTEVPQLISEAPASLSSYQQQSQFTPQQGLFMPTQSQFMLQQAYQVPPHQAYQVPQHQAYQVPQHQAYQVPQHQAYQVPQHQAYQVPQQAYQNLQHTCQEKKPIVYYMSHPDNPGTVNQANAPYLVNQSKMGSPIAHHTNWLHFTNNDKTIQTSQYTSLPNDGTNIPQNQESHLINWRTKYHAPLDTHIAQNMQSNGLPSNIGSQKSTTIHIQGKLGHTHSKKPIYSGLPTNMPSNSDTLDIHHTNTVNSTNPTSPYVFLSHASRSAGSIFVDCNDDQTPSVNPNSPQKSSPQNEDYCPWPSIQDAQESIDTSHQSSQITPSGDNEDYCTWT